MDLLRQRWTRDGTRRRDLGALSSATYGHDGGPGGRGPYGAGGSQWDWYNRRRYHIGTGTALTCASLECRTRGGTASLCGYSEWSGYESTPPKKYRTLTQGGHYRFKHYTDITCATAAANPDIVCTWSGVCSYNATTCALTQGGIQNCGGADATNCGNLGADHAPGSADCTTTATDLDAKVTGTCRVGGAGFGKYTEADQYAHLTTEDTEADAVTRLLAGAGGTWSSWAGASSTTCRAKWEARTSTFDLIYQESEWRRVFTGLTINKVYYLEVKMQRSLYGAGVFTLYQTHRVYGISDGSGNLTLSGTVPNTYGYETYAEC